MEKLAEYLDAEQAGRLLGRLPEELGVAEFARVRNLDYVFSPFEIYPLAPRVRPPLGRIVAFAVDMDGTSTTTEPLALNSLEYMVRRFTGLHSRGQWGGLDPHLDYPYVIGNSNFRHTEFLVQRYGDRLDREALRDGFIESVTWTLANMSDPQRLRDITQDARNCGLGMLLEDEGFRGLVTGQSVTAENVSAHARPFIQRFGSAFKCEHAAELVSAALDIYYMRYHSILRRIEAGEGELLSHELLGHSGRHLIEPMPAYDLFVPLVKGWLQPADADALFEQLRTLLLGHTGLGHSPSELDAWRPRLAHLAGHFQRRPARLALVTASIAYETHASMKEVIRVAAKQVNEWPVPAACKERLAEHLADYRTVFDGFVCASDACEPRLKPHRDLYTLALYQMSIPKSDYRCVVGLEDTEPGVISLRAAGIGCAIALPNHDTSRQNYTAATEVIRGGLPELILARNLLLTEHEVTA